MVDNLPSMQEMWVQSLGWEDSLGKGMATHSTLAGYSPWGLKESNTTERLTHPPTLTLKVLVLKENTYKYEERGQKK